jgi:hypothetical protein
MSAGMSRIIKITLTLGALCVAAIANYLVRPESVSAQTSRETYGYTPQKGIPEGSDDPKALAGHYYRGDGTGYNVDLTLGADGAYTAEWQGCLGTYGTAAGSWKLTDGLVVLTPSKETDMMRDHLRGLEVLKFKGHWILLTTNQSDRKFYDKWGITAYSCFQNTNSIFRGP